MSISVLIPTYRRANDLSRCLTAIEAQARPADEIVLVVRDSDEETRAFLASFKHSLRKLRIVTVCVPGVIAAMSAGLAEAESDIVALTDDDTAPYPDWLERIEAHFADPQVGGVGGRDWQPIERGDRRVVGIVQWHGRVIGNHHLGAGPAREVDILKGANCAYRAEPLKRIGFESRLRGAGAQVHWELALGMAMRQEGWKLIYDPAVAMDHFIAPRSDEDQFHRGIFGARGLSDSVYNETLILMTYLPPLRRLVFLVWAFLVGTRIEPGISQMPRLIARRDKYIWNRFITTYQARFAAMTELRGSHSRYGVDGGVAEKR